MLSLFYTVNVAQNGGRQLYFKFCTAWLCYAEVFERFPAFSGWFQLLLQFLPQAHVVSPLESCTPGFACTPQWSQVRRAKGPRYWASTSNPSVAKGFIQILTDNISGVPGHHDAGTIFHNGLPKAPLPAAWIRSLGEMLGKGHQ
jgi:hypothetical protein